MSTADDAEFPDTPEGRVAARQARQRQRNLINAAFGPRRQPGTPRRLTATQEARERELAREAEAKRAGFRLVWDDPTNWHLPDGIHPIRECPDEFLYTTLNWCVISVDATHAEYGPPARSVELPGVAAKRWLSSQIAFRALIQEALRRNLALPGVVAKLMREYIMKHDTALREYKPWQDRAVLAEQADLQDFMLESVIPPSPAEMHRDVDI